MPVALGLPVHGALFWQPEEAPCWLAINTSVLVSDFLDSNILKEQLKEIHRMHCWVHGRKTCPLHVRVFHPHTRGRLACDVTVSVTVSMTQDVCDPKGPSSGRVGALSSAFQVPGLRIHFCSVSPPGCGTPLEPPEWAPSSSKTPRVVKQSSAVERAVERSMTESQSLILELMKQVQERSNM